METSIGTRLIAPRRAGARRWLVIASLILHAGVIGAYVVVGMTRIERLTPDRTRIKVASMPKIDPGGASETPGGGKPEVVKQPRIRKAPVVQPPLHVALVTPDVSATAAGNPDSNRRPGDGGLIEGPPSNDPPGCPPNVECNDGDPPTTTVKKTPPPPSIINVAPNVITALRTRGDTQIHPPDTAQNAMMRDGKSKVFGIVQLCLDPAGRITKTKMLRSTGYPAYDDELLRGVQSWRYEPHRVNGTAVPVCSTVRFDYSIR